MMALGVLGGLWWLARALLLQCWLGLRAHLYGLSARTRLDSLLCPAGPLVCSAACGGLRERFCCSAGWDCAATCTG